MSESLVVRLDADTVRALEQLKRQIDDALPEGTMPPFTIAALARHSIRKWCDQQAAPVPNPCDAEPEGTRPSDVPGYAKSFFGG